MEGMRTLHRIPSSEAPEPQQYQYHPQRMMLQASTLTKTTDHHKSAAALTTSDEGEEVESESPAPTSQYQQTRSPYRRHVGRNEALAHPTDYNIFSKEAHLTSGSVHKDTTKDYSRHESHKYSPLRQ